MNFLILGHSTTVGGYGVAGFSYLRKLINSFEGKGVNIIVAFENHFNSEASFTDFQDKKVYYFSEWVKEYADSKYSDICEEYSNGVAYINYERLRCTGAKKSINNLKNHMEKDALKKMHFFFEEIFTNENIDCIVYETVSSMFSHMAYNVSVQKNIPYLGWISARIPGRYDLIHDPYGDIELRKSLFDRIKTDEIDSKERKEIEEYIESIAKVKPDYMKNNPFDMNKNFVGYYVKKVKKMISLLAIAFRLREELRGDYYNAHPLEQKYCYAKYRIKRQFKVPRLKKYFSKIDNNDKYYLFPLHYQPEASTGVNAPCYCNQADVIKNIAFSLPCGTTLYVKDHPCGIGFMSMKEYKQILSLPNVKYIDPQADNKRLILNSLGIVTITSTMGYEALLMKKPVVTFGKVFYNFHPYCIHVPGYEGLTSVFRSFFTVHHKDFDDVNIRFVKAYRDTSYEGKLLSEDEADIDKVTDTIIKVASKEGI